MTREDVPVIAVVAAGGALGALARYALTVAIPPTPGQLPVATAIANVTGCFLIGILMVVVTEVWTGHRLLRPFLGVGVLGGYTTLSTYAVEVRELLAGGRTPLAVTYLAGSVLAALAAVLAGLWIARAVVGARVGKGT
ncbi:fluoride efflux transporter CrcB [Rhodococcus sp. NPDC058505]|uniref:fluoride efflux transporter CrcB n=1 Tax=Rhodococcus sp. NPDC058505 TaxID=3346531 RepID=UPI003651B752